MKARILLFEVLLIGLLQNAFSACIDYSKISLMYKQTDETEYRMFNADYATFRARYDIIWDKGYRLKELDVSTSDGFPKYSAVWTKSTVSEIQFYGITHAQFKSIVSEKWAAGWRIFLVANYLDINSDLRFTLVFRRGNTGEAYRTGYTEAMFKTEYFELRAQGFRLKAVEMYRRNNVTYYTGIFHKSTDSEYGITEYTHEDFLVKYRNLTKTGWKLNLLDSYCDSQGQFFYTGYFRMDTDDQSSLMIGAYMEDFQSTFEDDKHFNGFKIQFMAIARFECSNSRTNAVRSAADLDAESMSAGTSEIELSVNVSPNPSSDGRFTLSSQLFESEEGVVEIHKMNGSKILSKAIQLNSFAAELDLSELQPGIYVMNILIGEMTLPKKIVIQ